MAKGELVIKSNKLKSALLDSNIGLISKLKIISKRTTLKPEKDINRLTTQMRYHRDNYMGKMGVGIQANLMKAVSYLMYGGRFIIDGNEIPLSSIASIKTVYGKTSITTKDGNTYSGTLERPKVALRRPSKTSEGIKYTPIEFKYVIDGKEYVYSHLERRTKHGDKSTAENGDTRINGYVDNVKVGSTPIVNATSLTIDVIGLMDFTGWDFDDVGYFMNQPAMLLLSSSRLKYNSNTTNSKKMLYDKFLELTKKKYDEHELSKTTLSREALTSVIEKYYGRDIRDVITAKDLTPADIATQLKVMEYFAEYKAITKSLFGASAALRLLKSIPTKFEKQLSTASAIQNIEEGMLWFDSPNFLNIPHIEAAANSFKTATNITKEVLPITQDGVIDALRDVAKNTSFSNTSSFAEYSVAQTVNILKDLFRHFLLGKVTEQVAGQGFADAYAEYVGIEIATGEPITLEKVTEGNVTKNKYQVVKNGKTVRVQGKKTLNRSEIALLTKEEIWAQIFLTELAEVKQDAEKNLFLDQLVVELIPSTGLKRLRFSKASGVDLALDAKIKLGFLTLPEDFKRKFIYYSLLVEGAAFGQSRYSSYTPL